MTASGTGAPEIITSLLTPSAIESLNADPERCTVFSARRDWPGRQCSGTPVAEGGAPREEQLFNVCERHTHLVSDPRPITA